jgi:hypothetical protein
MTTHRHWTDLEAPKPAVAGLEAAAADLVSAMRQEIVDLRVELALMRVELTQAKLDRALNKPPAVEAAPYGVQKTLAQYVEEIRKARYVEQMSKYHYIETDIPSPATLNALSRDTGKLGGC